MHQNIGGSSASLGGRSNSEIISDLMQPDSSGNIDFLMYWRGMEQILQQCGAWRSTLSSEQLQVLAGFRFLRTRILATFPTQNNPAAISVKEMRCLILETIQQTGPETSYWQSRAARLPEDSVLVTRNEVSSAVLAWLEELVCSEPAAPVAPPARPSEVAVHRAVAKPALEFHGRVSERTSKKAIVSFPGVYEKCWKRIVRDKKLSLSCIFFPDMLPTGQPHKLFGKHAVPCACVELYGGRADWGCQWYQHWQTQTATAMNFDKELVVVWKKGLKGDRTNGLGNSQKGEVRWLDREGLAYENMDIDELLVFLGERRTASQIEEGPEQRQACCLLL